MTRRSDLKQVQNVKVIISSSTLLSDPDSEADVESIWTELKSCLINACDSVCGWMKGNCKQERETWWWDETVESFVRLKKELWKEWQKGGSKEKYLEAQRKAKSGVYVAKRKTNKHLVSWKVVIASITNLANRIMKEGHIPSDWNLLYIVGLCMSVSYILSRF